MAEGKEIVIRIISESSGGEEQKAEESKVDVTGEKQSKATDVLNTAVLAKVVKDTARQVYNMGVSGVKYQLNKYYHLTDDYISEQNLNIALGVIGKVQSTAFSALGGAAIGAKIGSIGGIPGAVVGAAIGVIVDTVKTGVEIAHNYEQERINVAKMDVQLSFNRQRAGYSLTSGSRGENR